MLPQTSAFVIETLPGPPVIDRFYAKTPATAASDLGLIVMLMQALVILVLLLVVRRRRLLVVEDNAAEQMGITELLGYDDIEIVTVDTGVAALARDENVG